MNNTRFLQLLTTFGDTSARPAGTDKITWLGALAVRDLMTSPVHCTDPASTVSSAHLLMRERGVRRLPVVGNGRLVGILTLGDVRGAGPSEVSTLNRSELTYLSEQLKVERAMTREVVTVSADTSLKEAARLMVSRKIGGLPVVSAAGQVVGILTESDLFKALVQLLEIDELEPRPVA